MPQLRPIIFLVIFCTAAHLARSTQAPDPIVPPASQPSDPPAPPPASAPGDSLAPPRSTHEAALRFINEIAHLDSSAHWPHIKPALFLENLRTNIVTPLALYQGSNTNFCGYAALSYLPLHDDPLGYARFMLAIYRDGTAAWGKTHFTPSDPIKQAAGTLRFKGVLDIRPADQLWFLLLADHFKGYLNVLNRHYDPGDENTFWAAMNFGKFNRIIHRLLKYKVEARGSDLIRPGIRDLYGYLANSLNTGITYIYVNNTILHKKYHGIKFGFPTHFLVLTSISKIGDTITLTYWDYGERSLRQVSTALLAKILFGVSHCTRT